VIRTDEGFEDTNQQVAQLHIGLARRG